MGTALLIPPVYILTTLLFTERDLRAKAFGVISAMGGIGAAAGPLIGGLITSAISWRAAFVFQALVIVVIVLLAARSTTRCPPTPTRPFDTSGAVLSARRAWSSWSSGILAADNNLWLMLGPDRRRRPGPAAGSSARSGPRNAPAGNRCCPPALFRNRTSNLGLVTQNAQWLMLMGMSFVVSAYLQVVRGYDAIQTGVIFTADDRSAC